MVATAGKDGFESLAATSTSISIAAIRSVTTGSPSRVLSWTGKGLTYTATVHASGAVPTGTVTVYDLGRKIATASLPARATTIAIPLPRLGFGIHILTARYSGSDEVASSGSWPALVFVL